MISLRLHKSLRQDSLTGRLEKFGAEPSRRPSEGGGIATLVGVLLFLGALGYVLIFFFLGFEVPPDKIGVRHNKYPFWNRSESGFSNHSLPPGLHWRIPGFSEIVLLPRTFQIVNFNGVPEIGELNKPPIDVPSTNGAKISTDVTMLMRLFESANAAAITPEPLPDLSSSRESASAATELLKIPRFRHEIGAHGGPRNLINDWNIEQQDQLANFATTVQDAIIKSLSALSTIDFYDPLLREVSANKANQAANTLVNPRGVEVWATLIRRYAYDANIDDQIFAKNLQEATESLNAAMSSLAKARATTEKTRAIWDAKIRDLQVKGKADAEVLRSQGELYEAQRVAEGDLLVAKTQAKVEQARADVLQDGQGSSTYVAKQVVPLLKSLQGGIVTDLDPYDINQWAQKLSTPAE